MAKLSSTAIVQDLGLAASIGGTLFGRVALQPALYKIALPEERDLVSAAAWRRFAWVNLLAHTALASSWLIERRMLGRTLMSSRARSLATVKDLLVATSLATGVTSILLGNRLGTRGIQGRGPQAVKAGERFGYSAQDITRTQAITRTVGLLGIANLIANTAIAVVTRMLATERKLPARLARLARC